MLLAAGESRRMGRPKALLEWGGRPLIAHQVEMLFQAGVDDLAVVLGPNPTALKSALDGRLPADQSSRLQLVENPCFREGKIKSLKIGLDAVLRRDGPQSEGFVALLNVDQPRRSATIARVLGAHAEGVHRQGALFTVPTCQGRGGHPIVIDLRLAREFLELEEDSMGLRVLRDRHWDNVLRPELGLAEILLDVNTPEEYQTAQGGLASQSTF